MVAEEGVAAAIPAQRRIRKPRHRVLLRCRIPVAARIQAGAVLILLARILVAARTQVAVLLILLVRGLVAARILAQRRTSARTIRRRRNARRMRHKVISQGDTLLQPTISTPMLPTAISMQRAGQECRKSF